MARKIPCQYCKQRRRKCERSCVSEPCERCVRMNRKCLSQDLVEKPESSDDEDYLEEYEDNAELDAMNQQVKNLEYELENLEITLNEHRAIVKKEPVWDIEFVNGQLRLRSDINSLEELMLYGKSVIRYLSPFGSVFKTTSLRFERINPGFVESAMQIVNRIELPAHNQEASPAVISQRFSSGFVQLFRPEVFMNDLINSFFKCLNDTAPLIHEPSYREHFSSLENPLTDPITLAICAGASIFTCRHSFFDSQEKRYFGEYFYKLAMNQLTDIFDDPERELEALVVINLLQMFMITTLRISESKKWAGIGVIIATSLQKQHPDSFHGNSSYPRLTRIKYATIHRNSILSDCFLSMIEFITANRQDEIIHSKVQVDILPDESDEVRELLTLMNHIFRLALHPVSLIIVTQVRHMAVGEMAELNFEQIVQYEEVVSDWWHSLPEEYRITKEPYDCTKELIAVTDHVPKLIMACYLYTLTLSIQGCLIMPTYKVELENVNSAVRDRAIHLAMHSADVIILLAKKMDSLDTVCYSPARLLIRSIDSLLTLIEIKDKSMAKAARSKLDEYMYELSQNIPLDHQVPPSESPFLLLTVSQPGTTPSVTELYQNYPLPGEALMYDIINSTVQKNAGIDLKRNSSSS
ncbi:hypothetical protein BDF21DRAFT_428014 [Thamnidium elegans]|uniref:Zn(2)-C6 fungal-type domain-containing protein n=1 Tax=Thamnidium elegans TaxID=101142 RepID=A0A8H7SY41_9FUNG|nr:hypothetical protein INT48_000853 [Thamnidium elegans]KAI8064011.1 hypothetical protein BDF21DRAFT_428014 [Thamnidium elegans]